MARIREILTALESQQAATLERMEALQTRLDQSPGQAAMTSIQEEMRLLRENLSATEAELATLKATLPQASNPENAGGTPTNANAPDALSGAQPPARKRPAVRDWH